MQTKSIGSPSVGFRSPDFQAIKETFYTNFSHPPFEKLSSVEVDIGYAGGWLYTQSRVQNIQRMRCYYFIIMLFFGIKN